MDLNNAVHFASGYFANGYFISSVCGIIVLGSVAVWLYSVLGWRAQKGSWGVHQAVRRVTAILGQSGITAADALDKVSSLPANPINRQVVDDLSDLRTIDGKSYRVPDAARSSYVDLLQLYLDTGSLDAWPNVFVGVGLLLTFVGLALSLWNASQGAASGDIAVVKQSVTTLLEFSAVKFTTSLVALFCSISLGIVLRFQRHGLAAALLRLERRLDKLVPPLTLEIVEAYKLSDKYRSSVDESRAAAIVKTLLSATETRLAFQHLEQILEQGTEQTAQLTSFNSGLAIQLAGVLDSKCSQCWQVSLIESKGPLRRWVVRAVSHGVVYEPVVLGGS